MRGAHLECETRWAAHRANPFFVLELSPDAARADVERQGAKLLAMLAASVEGAGVCRTPLVTLTRTPRRCARRCRLADSRQRLAQRVGQGLGRRAPR